MGSPIGDLTLVNEGGVLAGIWMGALPAARAGRIGRPATAGFERAIEQLDGYFAGTRTSFDVPIAMGGDGFHRRVWRLLLEIPYGETRSYGDLARELGDVGLARAVGVANARNPLPIVVPCHRVIGSDGSLTGYAGGLDRKRFLLELESGVRPLFAGEEPTASREGQAEG